MSKKLTHNQAVFYLLVSNPDQTISLPRIMKYTAKACRSECYVVHSRVNDLRTIYGYKNQIENSTRKHQGVSYSVYIMHLPKDAAEYAKQLFIQTKEIPHYNQIEAHLRKMNERKSKPKQYDMFNGYPRQ